MSTLNKKTSGLMNKDDLEEEIAEVDAAPSLSLVTETSNETPSKYNMSYLVRALIKYNASDLHIKAGRPPLYRINGKLIPAKMEPLSAQDVKAVIFNVLRKKQILDLERKLQIDCSFRLGDLGRFRCSVFFQKGTISAVVRLIPVAIPTLEQLSVPLILKQLSMRKRGILLITGAAGAGKSTTVAALVQYINRKRPVHILTVEDPIEFSFSDQKATITQREVGSDTHSFQDALYAGLRQDPDIIMLGEIRDLEMVRTALTAAETGHLVLTTLHTNDARSTIERILDIFPASEQNQVRIQLANSLVGVLTQQLLLRADGNGRIPACEVLVNSPMIQNLIMSNELDRIPEAMANSNKYYSMQTWNQHLEQLVQKGLVTVEEALKASNNPEDLRIKLTGIEGFHLPKIDRAPKNS